MAGSYCTFCDRRCFVERRMPDDARWRPGEHVHLTTCEKGAAHDRQESGYDFTTAISYLAVMAAEMESSDGTQNQTS